MSSKNIVLPMLLGLSAAMGGIHEKDDVEVRTNKEGMIEYLFKQNKLSENNKVSKTKQNKMKGKKRR